MKAISPALKAHLAGPATTVAFLWKIKRTDGVILGFTDHDSAIVFNDGTDNVTYTPQQGATGSATETGADMTVGNQELIGFLESDAITETDILANRYDYATIEMRLVNWQDLTMGALLWKSATLGEVTLKNGQFQAELRGLEFWLGINIGDTYGPTCRVDLGDAKCTINLALFTQTGSVTSVSDLRTFVPSALLMVGSSTPTAPAPAKWFTEGVLTWTSGKNTGFLMEVGSWDGTTIILFENMPFPIAVGDTFSIEPGCDHTITTCFAKFNNVVNFRGENAIPGVQQIMMYPNADGSVPS